MNVLFEELFQAWCVPYKPENIPEYLRSDPVRAYGQYAFEKGFRLAMQLAVSCLDPEDLRELE
ncbi:MAG: hypothetical protein HFF80_05745 [Oscillospiraceae bacterium]|jgi:hypothetical protein|nr:hypothetical protein [Oscillospiraceae bacterium]